MKNYQDMSPEEKIVYCLDGIEKELSKIKDLEISCMARRDFCIECGLQELRNNLHEIIERRDKK